jgi:hypothetical protein
MHLLQAANCESWGIWRPLKLVYASNEKRNQPLSLHEVISWRGNAVRNSAEWCTRAVTAFEAHLRGIVVVDADTVCPSPGRNAMFLLFAWDERLSRLAAETVAVALRDYGFTDTLHSELAAFRV